jgi:3',5'-cyclic AMP phosphodiesterase CpdA
MMKKVYILLVLTSLFSAVAISQTNVTGYIYHDLNENQKFDRKEKGIPGVAVSNGKEVVKTDAKGKYTLPIGNDNIVFVIKPEGYISPLNQYNIPQFFYIHKPEGSPDLEFEGTEPTGPLPKELNFGLYPHDEPEEFRILAFGDPQPYTEREVEYFHRAVASDLKDVENIEFGISLGDLVGDDLDLFEPYKEAITEVGIPWYNVLGNHDINFDVDHDSLSDETYEAGFGPPNFAFNYGKVHFIILDDVLYPDPRDGESYWGGLREDQFAFIENDLKFVPKDHLIVLALHIPFIGNQTFNDEHRERLFGLLEDFPHTFSISGHTHIQNQFFFGGEEGWKQEGEHHHFNVGTTSGDWYSGKLNEDRIPISTMRDGTPKGYAFINFDGNDYSFDYRAFDRDADYAMAVFAPKLVVQNTWANAQIMVNFFIGSERDSLVYKIDDGEWKEMQHRSAPDPFYVREIMEWDFTEEPIPGRRPSNPVVSSHIWTGFLPTDLQLGKHTIYVKAYDMFGREYKAERGFRVVEREY